MQQPRNVIRALFILTLVGVAMQSARPSHVQAYLIDNWWPDGDNIVMDDVFLPANVWSSPAQFQLSEWNEVDTTDNSHPFRINQNPELSFGADDGDNTMGFLGEAGLNSQYGLSYADALAWAVCWSGSSGRIDECDMMLNPALAWQLVPDSNNFFQSTVLHEAGHIRGLDHYNNYLSLQNSGGDKILRGEVLYMDDKEAVRQNASHINEFDITIYNKYHTGSASAWMTVTPTTARGGETVNINNITVENRGTFAFGALRFGTYLSTNTLISTSDQLLNTGTFGSFGRFTFNTFNWSVTVPSVSDCGTYYIGGIIDDNNAYAERFEDNNAVAFVNGSPTPQAFTILLERDGQEPNDSFAASSLISLPFSSGGLTIDQDAEEDYYRFTLAQASRVNASISFTHTAGDVDMDLRNSSNVVLQSSGGSGNSENVALDLTPGTYYLHVYGYSSSSGSCNRYAMTVTASALIPDIAVLPSSWDYGDVAVGSASDRNFTVRNVGNTALNVSSSSVMGTNSAKFSIVSGSGAFSLAPAATHTVKVRFMPTVGGARSAILQFASDDPDENPLDVSLTGTGIRLSDLLIAAFSVPAVGGANQPISVTDTTENQGGASAASTTKFYLSPDRIFDAGDIPLGSRAIPALAAGESSSGTTAVTIPAGTVKGKYFLITRADAREVLAESDETNNDFARAIFIGADLIIARLGAPGRAVAGASITVSDTTKNSGGNKAGASITRYYLSPDALQDQTDVVLGRRRVAALDPQAKDTGSVAVTIPSSIAPGDYFLIAETDATLLVRESQEGNNTSSRPITILPVRLLTTESQDH